MAEMTKKTTAAAKPTKSASKSAKPAASSAKAVAKKAPAVAAAKKPVAKKPAAKSTAAKPVAKKVAAPVIAAAPKPAMRVSDEQRYRMVAEAAYYRAESNQFKSDPLRDWIDAEIDIERLLSGNN